MMVRERMRDSSTVMIAISLGAIFALALSAPMILNGYTGNIGGATASQGGQFFGGMMTNMMTAQGQTIPVDQAIRMMKDVPQYVNVIPANNTITFGSQSISLVVLATDHEGASNLTSNSPPSYATDDVFVIYGLVNPTLVVPSGAVLHVTTINLDKDMYHNFAITTIPPPYPYMAMQGMMYGQRQQQGPWMTMGPFLPPADYNQGLAHEYSYTVTLDGQADLWYLCTYPGHAEAGMYGQMVVSPSHA